MTGLNGKESDDGRLPLPNEHDRREDKTKTGTLTDIKFRTVLNRVSMWTEAIVEFYESQSIKYVKEEIKSGDGSKIKALSGQYQSVTVSLYVDTGTIMIQGKVAAMRKWANELFPQIRESLPKMSDEIHLIDNEKCSGQQNGDSGSVDETDVLKPAKVAVETEVLKPAKVAVDKGELSSTPKTSRDFSSKFLLKGLGASQPSTRIDKLAWEVEQMKASISNMEASVKVIPEIKLSLEKQSIDSQLKCEELTNENHKLKRIIAELETKRSNQNEVKRLEDDNTAMRCELIDELKVKNKSLNDEISEMKDSNEKLHSEVLC